MGRERPRINTDVHGLFGEGLSFSVEGRIREIVTSNEGAEMSKLLYEEESYQIMGIAMAVHMKGDR